MVCSASQNPLDSVSVGDGRRDMFGPCEACCAALYCGMQSTAYVVAVPYSIHSTLNCVLGGLGDLCRVCFYIWGVSFLLSVGRGGGGEECDVARISS